MGMEACSTSHLPSKGWQGPEYDAKTREIDGSSKPESFSEQSRHGEGYTALILKPSGIRCAWWEAGDTHYLLDISLLTMGRYTHTGDAAPIRGERFERETYIERI
jgi:hypothetical protein